MSEQARPAGPWTVGGLRIVATAWHVTIRRDAVLNRMLPAQDRARVPRQLRGG